MAKKLLVTKYLVVALLLAVCIAALLPSLSHAAIAETVPTLTVETKEINRGSRFTVDVDLSNNTGLVAMRLFIGYDSDVISLVDIQRGTALKTLPLNYNVDTYPAIVNWAGYIPDKTNGTVLTLVFDSNIDSEVEKAEINIRVDENNTLADYKVKQTVYANKGGVLVKKTDFRYVFVNWDESVLWSTDNVPYGTPIPGYQGATPTRPTDSKYSYVFSGKWQPIVSDKPDQVVLQAVYDQTPVKYKIEFYIADTRDETPQKIDTYTKVYDYGTETVLPKPVKEGCVFVGWFTDDSYKTRATIDTMPDRNVAVYGYFRLAVREQGPAVKLSYGGMDGDNLVVNVDIADNNGIATMKLALTYDQTALTLVGVERGTALGDMILSQSGTLDTAPYTLMWMADDNCYDEGNALKLRFAVKDGVSSGAYDVALTYNRSTDVTYFDNNKSLCFTAVDINRFTLPVGTVDNWTATTDNQQTVEAATDVPELANVRLQVRIVTHQVVVGDELAAKFGKGNELKDAYEIRLLSDDVTVAPKGKLTVRIKLTSRQMMCSNLVLYHYGDDGVVTLVSSKIDNGYLIFETDHLSTWLIVGETTTMHDDDCTAWMLIALAAVTAVLCIVAVGTHGAAMKAIGIVWSLAALGTTGYVVVAHMCMYTMMTSALCVLLVVVLLCLVLRGRSVVEADNGVAYRVRGGKRVDGCYLVHGNNGDFTFDVCDGNNRVIATSALSFDSIGAVKQGVALCRNNGAVAELTKDNNVCPRFVTVHADGKWHFELVVQDNFVLLRSATYRTEKQCAAAVENARSSIRSMDVYTK